MNADVPEFTVTIDDRGRVSFVHAGQARAWLKQFAGTEIAAQFYEQRAHRSARQNRAAHALLNVWAKERGWEVDTLKQFMLGRVFGWLEFADPRSGEVLKVLAEPHTSQLSMGAFCLFIETLLELAAEDGVWLQAPDEYRKAKAAAAKQAERDAKKAAKAA